MSDDRETTLGLRAPGHVPELTLRRYRAGELDPAAQAQLTGRLPTDEGLRHRLEALTVEQRAFEASISFERFAGGVERAARGRTRGRPTRRPIAWGLGALAAAAAFLLVVRPERPSVRLKGADVQIVLRLAPAGRPQRDVPPETITALAPGDRMRVGLRAAARMQVIVLTVDDAGVVAPVFPEASGSSLWAGGSASPDYLPGSLELYGRGQERLVVYAGTDLPPAQDLARGLEAAFLAAGRSLSQVTPPPLPAPGVAATFLFAKP